jgi:hypothetical protein
MDPVVILGRPARLGNASATDRLPPHLAAADLATVDLILDCPVPLDKALATDPPRRHPAAGGPECQAVLAQWAVQALVLRPPDR